MKKITFLLLHLGYGGIESATVNSANELSRKYDVEIISFYKLADSQTKNINKKVTVKYLYNGGPNRDEFNKALKSFNVFKLIKEGFKAVKILYLKKHLMIREIKKSTSDMIISTRIEYSLLLNKYGKNTIKVVQEHNHHNSVKKYVAKLKKLTNIDYMFALTESLRRDYAEFLKGSNVKIMVVPNIAYVPDKKSNLKNKNIITIARLHPVKKLDDLIEAFSKSSIKDNKLYIVGSGEEMPKLKELVKEKKLTKRVIFTGFKTKKQMEKYILDSSLFAMSSVSEGLPMVLLEAMGYGLPCIAYKTLSGVADIIDDGINGYVISNRNEKEYIEKMDLLLTDTKLQKEFSKNAIKKVKSFGPSHIIKIYDNIFKYNK